ncbi:tRNA (uridine(34)/cytosine(34)/5-carboxymethylaminomethyluridine(34)-2'-O)-methyltransferase TrmL [Sporolactobacillus inulinus]|uniref:Putative tRNA (cytidine(34)-2'-O)-methyltransferase n=2 Tax=Sporolactobacillus inulinus TaxID=2078 RepID=A0A4Y1Z8Q5_9BACL|nr:tRNA (uridine(34)/cytosine(34)/5-carboxymethylaminomethyluridine(34)-2'-O)-methyltransferase TrmL [Sporolactobacillus inulinus]KLI02242.1 tRNA methyltransferase [Sporolactobacillus inulinus CASD]GAY75365.1 tRNA (cytidine(34)-2'-O)-methyltransferase [Sporolactobacillus inulinus]GEB77287.1 putative tRNA (cytidine(34)-2'-O)-methyltransferase [Sporolactobacillus inulinus]
MSNHIVLYQPLIPPNTGNIARTCAGTNSGLHLIRPLGFSTDDKHLKRAGLDYWDSVDLHYYDSLDEFFERHPQSEYYLVETDGSRPYDAFDYSDTSKDYYFIFGRETTGLPKDFVAKYQNRCIRLPMTGAIRSLNLSNSAAIMLYEALRQQRFPGLS